MEQDNFDKEAPNRLFSEELSPPAAFSWENMEGGIQRPQRRRRRGLFYFTGCLGALLLLIGIGLFGLFENNHQQEKIADNIILPPIKNVEKTDSQPFAPIDNSIKEEQSATAENSFLPFQKLAHNQNEQATFTENFTENFTEKSSNKLGESNISRDKEEVKKNVATHKISHSKVPHLALEKIEALPILLNSLQSSENIPFLQKLAITEERTTIKNSGKWQLMLGGGTSFVDNIYHSKSDAVNAAMQPALSRPFAYTLSGGIIYQSPKNFFAGVGLRFVEHKNLFRYDQNENREIMVENAVTQVTINTFTGQETEVRDTRIDTEIRVRDVQKVNRIRLWEIPLTAGYAFNFKDWQVRLNGEIGAARMGVSGFVLNENLQLVDAANTLFPNQNRLAFFYGGGAEINRSLTSRLSAGLNLRMVQYGNIGEKTGLYQVMPRRVGLSFAIKYNL